VALVMADMVLGEAQGFIITAVVAYWHTQSEDRPGLYLKSFCKR
jgi:hypothetical protein